MCSMSRSGNGGGFSREDPAWLRRLWVNQRVALSAGKLHGWSVHVQRFLGFVHRHEPEGPVGVLAGQFLEDMQLRDPPVGSWRLDQRGGHVMSKPGVGVRSPLDDGASERASGGGGEVSGCG